VLFSFSTYTTNKYSHCNKRLPTQAVKFMVVEWYNIVKERETRQTPQKGGRDMIEARAQSSFQEPLSRKYLQENTRTRAKGNKPIAHSFVNFDVTTATSKSTHMHNKELESK
jgi:hypothetical protein